MLVFGSVSTEIGHVVRMCFCAIKINEIEAKMTDAQRQVPGRRSKELRCQVVSRTPWFFASGDVLFPNPWGSSRTFVSKVGLIARVPLSGPVIPNLRFGTKTEPNGPWVNPLLSHGAGQGDIEADS